MRGSVAELLAKGGPGVKVRYERLMRVIRGFGRKDEGVQVSGLKTMIAFNAPALMGGAVAMRKGLKVSLILPGEYGHRTLRKRQAMSVMKVSHEFLLVEDGEMDEAFCELVREAWELARE